MIQNGTREHSARKIDQIPDDFALLEEMMDDLKVASPLYQPTNYWAYYEKRFLPELRNAGLRNVRRRRDSVLSSFGATDLTIKPKLAAKAGARGVGVFARMIDSVLNQNPLLELKLDQISDDGITRYFYAHTKAKFDGIRMDLRISPAATCGNPEDLVEIDSLPWSRAHLQYCSMFADAARYIRFPAEGVLCELGAGMGRNVQVMAKLFDRATLLHFDIPPQLYVANQYLQEVFGSRVLPYREAKRLLPAADDGRVPKEAQGKILLLPTWRMPDWASTKIDLFWNSASFQEMEPKVVTNYLQLVRGMRPEWIYINANPTGCTWGEDKEGGGRIPVTESVYVEALRDLYELHCAYDTDYFLRPRALKSYVFHKKAVQGTKAELK